MALWLFTFGYVLNWWELRMRDVRARFLVSRRFKGSLISWCSFYPLYRNDQSFLGQLTQNRLKGIPILSKRAFILFKKVLFWNWSNMFKSHPFHVTLLVLDWLIFQSTSSTPKKNSFSYQISSIRSKIINEKDQGPMKTDNKTIPIQEFR